MIRACVVALLALCAGSAIAGELVVVDADTLKLDGVRIRLFGVDALERNQTCLRRGQSWDCGREAARALAAFIGDRPVTCEPVDHDRYKRQVSICRAGDDDLGAWLVREGWAVAYTRYSWRYVPEEMTARRDRKGMWSGAFELPETFRKR